MLIKRAIFTILWIFLFFIISQVIVTLVNVWIIDAMLPSGLRDYNAPLPDFKKVVTIINTVHAFGWVPPIIALILGIRGKLPGTH